MTAQVEAVPQVIAHIARSAEIVALLSTRVWGDKIPDNPAGGAQTYPYARAREISSAPRYTHTDQAGRVVIVQIDVYDDDQTGADALTELLRNYFNNYRGMIGSLNAGWVKAHKKSGVWEPGLRNYWRVLELEIKTND
jgi:hypothetical protein